MSPRRRPPEPGPTLFDLPLVDEPDSSPLAVPDRSPEEAVPREDDPGPFGDAEPAQLPLRVLAGTADLLAVGAVAVAVVAILALQGVALDGEDWPAIAILCAVFSFLYTLASLALWGQTPGMAWAGLVARGSSGEPLTFGQSARRWLAALLTIGLAGLPLLLAIGRRPSLVDRLSGSRTLQR